MPNRDFPYGAFNFLVNLNLPGVDPATPLGGFSDVSGLGTELTLAEYRNGNDPENNTRKITGLNKSNDVTLKRGVVDSSRVWEWVTQTRTQSRAARRDVTITLRAEDGTDVQTWVLRNCLPLKWTGPTFAAKGGTDVAMEELTISSEKIDLLT